MAYGKNQAAAKMIEERMSPYLRRFSTRIDRSQIECQSGKYDDEKGIWSGELSGMAPKTRKKSAKVLSEDESADW